MFEREAEVAALEAMLGAAHDGDGRLVVVEGSAGIGKTRLLTEARALAGTAELDVLTARGGELEGELAFGIVRQLFEAPLAAATPKVRSELLAGAAELSASLFASAPTLASGETAESSFAMLHGLYWLTANFASRKPTLLVVDDLHWTDEPSLRWLVYLARRLEGLPLLLLLGTRPPAQATTPGLVSEILADPQAALIRPGPLGPRSIKEIARGFFAVEPEDAFAAELESVSGGNPLFARALLDAAARESIPPTTDHAPRLHELGPQAVSHAVAARLGRLPDEATQLIRAAAILGDGTALAHAVALAGLEPAAAGQAAHALVGVDLLRREDPIEFFHPLVRTGANSFTSPSYP
jgi:predicted ATPase